MLVLAIQALIVLLALALLLWLRPTAGCEPAPDFPQFPIMLRALGGLRQYPLLLLVSFLLQFVMGLTVLVPLLLGWGPPNAIEGWCLGVWFVVVVPTLLPPVLTPAVLVPLRGGRMSMAKLLPEAAAAALRAFPISLLVAGLVAAPVGCTVALAEELRATGAGGGGGGAAALMICGVVAGLILLSALCLAPVLLIDRRVSLRDALRGALDLSHGYRVRLLGIHMLFLWIAAMFLAWFHDRWANLRTSELLIALLLTAFLWAVHAVTLVIIYHRLRDLKHGDASTRIADVFQ